MDEIFRRGECRNFKELTPVPDEQLLTLVKAGMQARSVGNQKDRDFIIVTREDLVKAISHNSIVAGPARKASAAIVIVGKKEGVSFPDEWSFDCAAAAENILLEAEHLGWGASGCRFIHIRTERSTSATSSISRLNLIHSAS